MNNQIFETENSIERQHSCKWYFDEAKDVFDKRCEERKKYEVDLDKLLCNEDSEEDKQFVDRQHFTTKKTNNTNFIKELVCKDQQARSIFSLFVVKTNKDDTMCDGKETELFESKKFEICKALNAIDSIISRLCTKNADSESTLNGKIVEPKTILKWLFTAASQGEKRAQERDRVNVVLYQVIDWYTRHKLAGAKVKKDYAENIGPRAQTLMKMFDPFSEKGREYAIKYKWDDSCIEELSKTVKESLILTLNDMDEAYEKLNGFRRYAIRVELATDDMLKKENLNKLLSLAYAILNFLTNICMAYMRVNELQLPRAEFQRSRLIHSNISNSNFSNADFREVDITNGVAKNCDFSSASLTDVVARGADFSDSIFSYADLSGVQFSGAILNGVKMDSAYLGQDSTYSDVDADALKLIDSINELKIGDDNAEHKKSDDDAQQKKSDDNAALINADCMKALADKDQTTTEKQKVSYGKDPSLDFDRKEYEKYIKGEKNTKYSKLIKMNGASIKGSMLSDLDLSLIDATAASFNDSDLSSTTMAYSQFESTDFTQANLAGAKAYSANLKNASFVRALGYNAWFVDCNMESANFTGANLTNAKLINFADAGYIEKYVGEEQVETNEGPLSLPCIKEDAQVVNQSKYNKDNTFRETTANRIFVAGCDMSCSVFNRAIFRNATLYDVNVQSTVWDDADLTYSLLCGVIFNRSSLRKMSLQEAKLYAVDFTCCNLSSVKMLGCVIDKANFNDSNLSDVNLSHSLIKNTVFRESPMTGMNMSKTKFVNCTFYRIHFGDCIGVSKAMFENCTFVECTTDEGRELQREKAGGEIVMTLGTDALVYAVSQNNIIDMTNTKFSTYKEEKDS